ncbi:MAG: MFS transporter, partial [Candidatus Eiseniibacteriota bacterium]
AATLHYTGLITSLLLLGWAAGGILFGRICDSLGRTRTLMLTMLAYAIGTGLCALATSIPMLIAFRVLASLGIGGEWAAGAAMVAEVVPEKRRVEAGAFLYTAAPMGLFLATYITYMIQGVAMPGNPGLAWRYVFAFGLVPAAVALAVRVFVREPERWRRLSAAARPRIAELFSAKLRHATLSGFGMALIALVMWWSCNAFIGVVASGLASERAKSVLLDAPATQRLIQQWIRLATNLFNIGGLLGTLLAVPIAKAGGRRAMFATFFLLSAASIMGTFGLHLSPYVRLHGYFFIGLSVFGVFGSFTYYLPELFPTRLRGTGSGFCYNSGRIIAAIGPVLVGNIAAMGKDALGAAIHALFWVGAVPIAGLALIPWVIETRGRELAD